MSEQRVPTNTYGFFTVWNPDRGLPFKRHATMAGAQREAQRLAEKHPNQSFYVMSACCVSRSAPVIPVQPVVQTQTVRYSLPSLRSLEEWAALNESESEMVF